jgi:hypothetical protein
MKINKFTLKDLLEKDSIPLFELFKLVKSTILRSWIYFIIIFVICLIISILDFKLTPVMFETQATVLIDQSNSGKNSSGLGSLGTILGVNIDNTSGSSGIMGPDMYKDIVMSQAFLNEMVIAKIPQNNKNTDSITLEQYAFTSNILKTIPNNRLDIENKNNLSLTIKKEINPSLIFSNQVPPIVKIDENRMSAIGFLKNRITINIKEKNCIVKVKMEDPFISAISTKLVLEKLIMYITLYKTSKSQDNLNYLEKKYKEAEFNYKNAQQKLASFKDRNLGLMLQTAQATEQILNNEVAATFGIYNQFLLQTEQAKIDLKKETPIFSILEPITIPEKPIEPSLSNIIIKYTVYFLIACFLFLIYTLIKPLFNEQNS